MAGGNDSVEERIIPVSLRVDENTESNDDENDENEIQQDNDPTQCKINDYFPYSSRNGAFINKGNEQSNSGRQYPGMYGWYPQLPPTINIFTCPPPPPPQYGVNGGHPILRPRFVPGFGTSHFPQQGFSINVPPNVQQQPESFYQENISKCRPETPPPPQLTTPFFCDDSARSINSHDLKQPSMSDIPRNQSNSTQSNSLNSHQSALFRKFTKSARKNARFHPYHEGESIGIKKEFNESCDNKHYLCVDTQDFDSSEISIKIKNKTLTIEGKKSSNVNCSRFSNMKHEYTFNNPADVKNTSCTFHPNGTLILQFNNESEDNTELTQTGNPT